MDHDRSRRLGIAPPAQSEKKVKACTLIGATSWDWQASLCWPSTVHRSLTKRGPFRRSEWADFHSMGTLRPSFYLARRFADFCLRSDSWGNGDVSWIRCKAKRKLRYRTLNHTHWNRVWSTLSRSLKMVFLWQLSISSVRADASSSRMLSSARATELIISPGGEPESQRPEASP